MTKPRSALRTLLALVTLLVVAFGCEQTPPEHKLGTFYPATTVPATFSSVVTLSSGHRRMTAPATAAPLSIAKALSGHVDGAELTIDIPVGATSLYLAPELNVSGSFTIDATSYLVTPWNAAKRHKIELAYSGSSVVGAMVELVDVDSTAPTVVSASATGATPNAVTAIFSEPTVIAAADLNVNITAPCSVGTTRTITAVEAGQGTTTVTFTLSGNYVGTETCKLVVGSGRTSTDYSGNLVATNGAGTSIVMSFGSAYAAAAAWTDYWEKNVGMVPSSGTGSFVSWTGGNGRVITKPGAGTPTRTAGGSVAFTGAADEQLQSIGAALSSGTDFAMHVKCKRSGTTPAYAHPMTFDSGGITFAGSMIQTDLVWFDSWNGSSQPFLADTPTTGLTDHNIFIWRTGGTVSLQVDSRTVVTFSDSDSVTGFTHLMLASTNVSGGGAFNGEISYVGHKSGAGFSGGEITAIIAAAL